MTSKDVVFLSIGGGTLAVVLIILWYSMRQSRSLRRVDERLSTSVEVKAGEELKETLIEQQEMTRQHISATVGTIAHETGVTKGLVYDLHKRLTALIGLMANFVKGIGK